MNLKQTIKKLIPNFIKKLYKNRVLKKQQKEFNYFKKIPCDTKNLLEFKEISLENIFQNDDILNTWHKWHENLDTLVIPDFTGGINPGDRKAIFFLIRFLKPKSVLEIGTHIGASTVNIAAALKINYQDFNIKATFKTIDIRDVNSISDKPWIEYGTEMSPLEMIKKIECESFAEFITDTSVNYFEKTSKSYDFIFLDGNHSAKTVYEELPLALRKLNNGGVILLHDYFPDGKPLWYNNSIIQGPYLATERLIKEGADIIIVPLGALPWPTKLNSNVTSLALCLKK